MHEEFCKSTVQYLYQYFIFNLWYSYCTIDSYSSCIYVYWCAVWGVIGSFSIVYSVLFAAFQSSDPTDSNVALKLSFVISVNAVVSCGGCLVAGPLYDRFGARVSTVSAVILGSAPCDAYSWNRNRNILTVMYEYVYLCVYQSNLHL